MGTADDPGTRGDSPFGRVTEQVAHQIDVLGLLIDHPDRQAAKNPDLEHLGSHVVEDLFHIETAVYHPNDLLEGGEEAVLLLEHLHALDA